jgi:hypothetical protein
MLRWEDEYHKVVGEMVHNFYLLYRDQNEDPIATLTKLSDTGNWVYTCPITHAWVKFLADGKTSESDAKLAVQEIIYDYCNNRRDYYQKILGGFEN